jgi:hypothetical protein
MTYDWWVDAAGTTVATNGSGVNNLAEIVASNAATQSTGGLQPIYNTNQINTLPAMTYNGFTSNRVLTFGTSIPITVTTYTFFAVVQPATSGASLAIIGGQPGAMEYRINSSLHQELLVAGVVSLGVGTATISTTSPTTVVGQWNSTSGAWAFFICSGGTCSSDGSGTQAGALTQPTNLIGEGDGGDSFNGIIAEVGFLNGTSTTGIGAYSLACYAI